MIPIVIALYAWALLALFSVPSANAGCGSPGWSPELSNPLQSGSGTITSSPNNQISAANRMGFGANSGIKFMASDDKGQSTMGLIGEGDTVWTVQPGYTGANFTDFYMFNVDKQGSQDMYLLYVSNRQDLYLVTQTGDSTTWYDNQLIYSDVNGLRFPQGQIIDGNIYVAIQSAATGNITILYRGENDSSFSNWGVASYPNMNQFQTANVSQARYAMFQGSVDQGSNITLWFMHLFNSTGYPYVNYATNLASGNVQLSTPQQSGDLVLANTTSVSVITNQDTYQAMLFRTGLLEDDPIPYGVYTVIKLSSGPVVATCSERTLWWGPANNIPIASYWGPGLTTNNLFDSVVSVTWVDSQDGSLNSLAGNAWD